MIVSYRGLGAPRGGAGLGMRCRAVVAEGVAPPAGRARLEAVLVEALRPARQPRRAQWVPLRAPPGGRADERYVRRLRQRELRERLPRRPRAQPCRPRERRPVPGRTKQPSRSSSAKHAVAGDRERVDAETYMFGLSCIIGVAATSPARICWVTHRSIEQCDHVMLQTRQTSRWRRRRPFLRGRVHLLFGLGALDHGAQRRHGRRLADGLPDRVHLAALGYDVHGAEVRRRLGDGAGDFRLEPSQTEPGRDFSCRSETSKPGEEQGALDAWTSTKTGPSLT